MHFYLCLSSRNLFIFSVTVFPFYSYFSLFPVVTASEVTMHPSKFKFFSASNSFEYIYVIYWPNQYLSFIEMNQHRWKHNKDRCWTSTFHLNVLVLLLVGILLFVSLIEIHYVVAPGTSEYLIVYIDPNYKIFFIIVVLSYFSLCEEIHWYILHYFIQHTVMGKKKTYSITAGVLGCFVHFCNS